jgi:hypothetical protein
VPSFIDKLPYCRDFDEINPEYVRLPKFDDKKCH